MARSELIFNSQPRTAGRFSSGSPARHRRLQPPVPSRHPLHGARREVAAAAVGRAVHRHDVIVCRSRPGRSFRAPLHRTVHSIRVFPRVLCRIRGFPHSPHENLIPPRQASWQGLVRRRCRGQGPRSLATHIRARSARHAQARVHPAHRHRRYIVVVNVPSCASPAERPSARSITATTRYPGGLKQTNFAKAQAARPSGSAAVASKACAQGPLGYAMLRKLKLYAGRPTTSGAATESSNDIKNA